MPDELGIYDDQHQREQQQHATRRRKLFQDRPEELLGYIEPVASLGNALDARRIDLARVQPITGARVGLELRPQLVEFESVCDALPELMEASAQIFLADDSGGLRAAG